MRPQTFYPALMPDTPDDWREVVRAIAATTPAPAQDGHGMTLAGPIPTSLASDNPPTMTLEGVTWPDGTPTWDRHTIMLGTVTITLPDGTKHTAHTYDDPGVGTWDDLTAWAEDIMSTWATQVGMHLSGARDTARKVADLASALDQARAERNQALKEAAAYGVTPYRLAQVTGLSQPAVHRAVKC